MFPLPTHCDFKVVEKSVLVLRVFGLLYNEGFSVVSGRSLYKTSGFVVAERVSSILCVSIVTEEI